MSHSSFAHSKEGHGGTLMLPIGSTEYFVLDRVLDMNGNHVQTVTAKVTVRTTRSLTGTAYSAGLTNLTLVSAFDDDHPSRYRVQIPGSETEQMAEGTEYWADLSFTAPYTVRRFYRIIPYLGA